ncbi:galactose-1-phosphate uridylyltransferase (plasmid) [Deinococcus sp. VB343]|uniref:Galactose-1-phosphate uridylyltransferase n=1 Tax=Deinococcus sp. VB142 TaxID=3112952 RepID=A0AAU6Q7S8_9DEIO
MTDQSGHSELPPFYLEEFRKPDGRRLTLYGLKPIRVTSEIPSPDSNPVLVSPVQRWHPLRGEWVMYASHRAGRTFLPPAAYNPLRPTTDPQHPTELPQGEYDVAVFENRFPSLVLDAPEPQPDDAGSRAGKGACEVVVFGQQSDRSLRDLSEEELVLLLSVWEHRTEYYLGQKGLKSVLCFENRGVEAGVTLHHPHGQIYVYDHVPPVAGRALEMARQFERTHGQPWLEHFVSSERDAQKRLVLDDGLALSLVPPFARYSYETWIIPARPVSRLSELSREERSSMARVLKDALSRLDALFETKMPYLLTVQQAPEVEGAEGFPLRIEIYPYLRDKGKLKYLAGTEQGAGEFANDKLPEEAALQLHSLNP